MLRPFSIARAAASLPTKAATSDLFLPAASAATSLSSDDAVAKEVAAEAAGKNKSEVAAVVGKLAATRAAEKGITTVSFDRNGYLYHGRVKMLADAAREGGLKF